ncbi:O-antigen ligase family protein [Winogradskyella aurantiaca]|uniref:O-antigen ligase family protein n=1 Tax=Winogradskyella aurantiaca TaxID=2219558 RepID=UPI00130038E7|nr:O-antigen ligase family protein [Winogradskyella aurantiaca]
MQKRKTLLNSYLPYKGSFIFLCSSLFLGNALVSISSVIALLVLLIDVFRNKFKVQFKKLYLLFSVYFFTVVIATVLNANSFTDLINLTSLLPFIYIPLYVSVLINKKEWGKIVKSGLNAFIISGVLSFILSFFYGVFRAFHAEKSFNSIYITYRHLNDLFGVEPIYVSALYFFSIVIILEYSFLLKTIVKNKITLSVLFIFAIFLSSSRITLVVTLIYVGTKFFLNLNRMNKKSIFLLLSCMALVFIISFTIPTLKSRIMNFDQNISSYSGLALRKKLWKNSWELIEASPLMGYGFRISQIELQGTYKKNNFRRAFINKLNCHNQYFQSLLDSGIFGLIVLLAIGLSPFYFIKDNRPLYLFVASFFFLIITESFLVRQIGITYFVLFFFLLLGINDKNCITEQQKYQELEFI